MNNKEAAFRFFDFLIEEAQKNPGMVEDPNTSSKDLFTAVAEKLVTEGFLFKDEKDGELYHMTYPELSFAYDYDLIHAPSPCNLYFGELPELHKAASPDLMGADIGAIIDDLSKNKLTYYGNCDRMGQYQVRFSEEEDSRTMARMVALMGNLIRRYGRLIEIGDPKVGMLQESFVNVSRRMAPQFEKQIAEETHLFFWPSEESLCEHYVDASGIIRRIHHTDGRKERWHAYVSYFK